MGEPSASSPIVAPKVRPVRKRPLIQKQPAMTRVLIALVPIAASAVYFFGWRVLAVLAICNVAGFATEYLMARRRGKPVSGACFVTCWLYALSLPPTVPLWIAVVGVVVAILFAKEVFGGFGRNFANPAITGRAFLYICFPNDLTNQFVPAFRGFPGGLTKWSFQALEALPERLAAGGQAVADAVSQASPMWVAREYGVEAVEAAGSGASIREMLLGSIGGTFQPPGQAAPRILVAGSMGEGCAVLIVLAAIWLLWTKTANWRLMLGGFVGLVAASVLFRNVFGFSAAGEVSPLAWQLSAGSTLYVLVFMVTDPVSAPKRRPAQLAYGLLIGMLIVVLRWRGVFVAAATFAVLLGNLVAPLLDEAADAWKARKRPTDGGAKETTA